MIDIDLVQAALLVKTQSLSGLVALLPDGAQGIREFNWKGSDFNYPCVRLELGSQTDVSDMNVHCPAQQEFSFYIFSEKASSKEADNLAGKIVSGLRGISFSQNNIKFVRIRVLENIHAIAQDERTWRAQVRCQSIVHSI